MEDQAGQIRVRSDSGRTLDRRTRARELAVQALYQLDVQGNELLGRVGDFFQEHEQDAWTRELAMKWTRQTWEKVGLCDELISGSTMKWRLSRLSPVDKGILRLAVCQLVYCKDIPPKVVINEAIELAKRLSTDKSPAFVNGVLDSVLRRMAGGESTRSG